MAVLSLGLSPGVTDRFDTSLIIIQSSCKYFHVLVCAWLKERRIFTQNAFLVHAQAILKVIEICVQFHRLSLYPNDWLPSLEADVKVVSN